MIAAPLLGEVGGPRAEVLKPVAATGSATGEELRDLARRKNLPEAERVFAAIANGPVPDAVDGLMIRTVTGVGWLTPPCGSAAT